nr:hypothetical protein [Mesorhizobium ciceri]
MATHVRHPIGLPALRPADARTFASLYAVESFARATVSSVIPIQAYEILPQRADRLDPLHRRGAARPVR